MSTENTKEGKPDFHMIALAKSECAKDAGELTVVRLGYVTQLLEETYETHHQELQKAREATLKSVKQKMYDATFIDSWNLHAVYFTDIQKIIQSELDQPTDGMPHPFANPEGVYGSQSI